LRKEPNHTFVKLGQSHIPSVKKVERKLEDLVAEGALDPTQFSGEE